MAERFPPHTLHDDPEALAGEPIDDVQEFDDAELDALLAEQREAN